MTETKRWYDVDPTVSLAISLMKNSPDEVQLKCAEYIIEKAKNLGVENEENILNETFTYILRRWYDSDIKKTEAFSYLKAAPIEIQKEICLEVIELLQTI